MRLVDLHSSRLRAKKLSAIHIRKSYRVKMQRIKKHRRKHPSRNEGKELRVYTSSCLHFFKNIESSKNLKLKHEMFSLPKHFCLIEHPDDALTAISRAVKYCLHNKRTKIKINYSQVEKYNLGSEALLALGVQQALKHRSMNIKPKVKQIGGYLPNSADHHQLVHEIGIIKHTKGKSSALLPYSTKNQHLFEYWSKNVAKANASCEDDKASACLGFTKHVDECVQDHNLTLTDEAKIELIKSISEVIDNAERHSHKNSGSKTIWHLRGYLNSHSESQNFEVCAFNFGRTIADTFNDLEDGHYSKKVAAQYVELHKNKFSEEQLITLAALQEAHSCKNEYEGDTNGGGTFILIQFFEQMLDAFCEEKKTKSIKPMMSIVSGKTHILFDGTYKITGIGGRETSKDMDSQSIIAFNKQNDLKYAPDAKYIREMKNANFPGVAISIRFPLQEKQT